MVVTYFLVLIALGVGVVIGDSLKGGQKGE